MFFERGLVVAEVAGTFCCAASDFDDFMGVS